MGPDGRYLPPGRGRIKGGRIPASVSVQAHRHESADTKMTGGSASCSLCDLCSPRADWCHG